MSRAGAWPGETATTVGSPHRPHPEQLMSVPLVPAAFRISCGRSSGIACVSRLQADFRGLGGSGAGPRSLGGTEAGGILFTGHLQGLGQCLWEEAQAVCLGAFDTS